MCLAFTVYAGDQVVARANDGTAEHVSEAVLLDAMGSILGFYYGAKQTTDFCANHFSDMRADLEDTQAHWVSRNGPVAAAARKVVLEHNLMPNQRVFDESMQSKLEGYLASISSLNETRQKIHCFDVMVMMDEEANDIRNRYAREYRLLQSM